MLYSKAFLWLREEVGFFRGRERRYLFDLVNLFLGLEIIYLGFYIMILCVVEKIKLEIINCLRVELNIL